VEAKDLREDNPGLLTWTLESALGMMSGPAWRGIPDKSNDEFQSLSKREIRRKRGKNHEKVYRILLSRIIQVLYLLIFLQIIFSLDRRNIQEEY
jgi:hypothetical protein